MLLKDSSIVAGGIARAQMLEPGHPHLTPVCNRIIISYITGLLSGLNDLLHVKCLEEFLALLSAYKL